MEKRVIRAAAPLLLGVLSLCAFSIVGLVAVTHPGADPRLVSRLTAGGVCSVFLWLFWHLGIETRIVLDGGEVAVHYPFFVRRVGTAQVARVRIEGGDLTIRTVDGRKIKPPAYRASVLGALRGNRGSRAVQAEIEQYLVQGGPRAAAELHTALVLRPWVLIIPLVVLGSEAYLSV